MFVGWLERPSRCLDSFYYFLFSTVFVAPFAIIDSKPFGAQASVFLIGIALTLLVDQLLIVFAYRYASAVKVGFFVYSVIVFTALDRLGHLGPGADAVRSPRHGDDDWRGDHHDTKEVRCVADPWTRSTSEHDRDGTRVGG